MRKYKKKKVRNLEFWISAEKFTGSWNFFPADAKNENPILSTILIQSFQKQTSGIILR